MRGWTAALELLEGDVNIDHPFTDGRLLHLMLCPNPLLGLLPEEIELLIGEPVTKGVGVETPAGECPLGDLAGGYWPRLARLSSLGSRLRRKVRRHTSTKVSTNSSSVTLASIHSREPSTLEWS